jgi:tetratricopeptide (TPR) repeat protein
MTQNNLGNALSSLGERESGTVRLEQAVRAYRAALQEWTRERVPLDWAMTQNNLGTALSILGERENQAHLLRNALEAVKGAAEIYRAAGMVQYDDYFADRIRGLEAEMGAMDPTALP